jgi:hypothetical protein
VSRVCAEIQTSPDDAEGGPEWLVIETRSYGGEGADSVSFRHDYINIRGERATWQDMGSGFDMKHLDEVIAILERIRQVSQRQGDPDV